MTESRGAHRRFLAVGIGTRRMPGLGVFQGDRLRSPP